MGTDGHVAVEVQTERGWVPVWAPIWPNPGYGKKQEPPLVRSPSLPRNYALFSVLADVRNRTGRGYKMMLKHDMPDFGEIEVEYDTDDGGHDPLAYIDTPRGVPDDANSAWKMFVRQDGVHDPTWLLLSELKDAPWDQVIYEQAVAYEDEYVQWLETGVPPKHHARGVGGPGMRVVNEVEYAAGVRGEQTAVDFRWTGNTVREDLPRWWWATLAVMEMIAPDDDLTKVRALVAFDS